MCTPSPDFEVCDECESCVAAMNKQAGKSSYRKGTESNTCKRLYVKNPITIHIMKGKKGANT